MSVLVTRTMQQACSVLDQLQGDQPGLRVWPLDCVSGPDRLALQQEAQRQLGAERVVLPVQLVKFEPAVAGAVQRLLGRHVVAVDDAAAAELARRFHLSAVTLEGSVSHVGQLSGGFQTASVQREGPWRRKLQADSAAARLAELREELCGCSEDLRKGQLDAERVQDRLETEEALLWRNRGGFRLSLIHI